MRKLSRFGAAALALALSVTFLTPVQAQAAKNENREYLQLKEELRDVGVIDQDNVKTAEVPGTDDVARDKVIAAAVEKGIFRTTKPGNGVDRDNVRVLIDSKGKEYYCNNSTSGITSNEESTALYAYGTIYKNTQANKTSIFREEVQNNYTEDEAKARTFQSAIRVKKGEITYVGVQLNGGDTTIEKIKSSKKSIAKVSLYKKMSTETITNWQNVQIDEIYDAATGKTTWDVYFYTTVGAKVVVGTYDEEDKAKEAANNIEMTASSATRWIKIDAKKPGKTKLTFNIKNKNGSASKVSTTIHVVDDTSAFSKLTYAGQSLLPDKDLTKKSFYAKGGNEFYTTKAKGKLVAKANKNFVIKKIEVGKLYAETETKGLDDEYYPGSKYSDDYSAYSSTSKTYSHKVDLNGDGDYDDTINGVEESDVEFKFTKVKSGKTLKLSKVGRKYDSSTNYTSKDWKNRKGEYKTFSSTTKDRNFTAPTMIRITYYDKLLKTFDTAHFTINLKVSK